MSTSGERQVGTLSPHSLNHFLAAGFVKSIVVITLRGGKSLGIELLRREGHALHCELDRIAGRA